jgi:hypothetical protein
MADKKVDRNVRLSGGPVTRTDIGEAALPQHESAGIPDIDPDKGKSALLDKFRAREEKYHLEHPSKAEAEATVHLPAEPEVEPSEKEGSA